MNPFQDNPALQDLALYSIDWGVFLRHNLDSPIMPFLFLQKGAQRHTRVLVTDGDVFEYALKILEEETEPFQTFAIGAEGTLSDESGAKVDAIIVQAFDTSSPQGVMLAQAFEPLEKSGTFKKVDRLALLGQPPNPIPVKTEHAAPVIPGSQTTINAARVQRGKEGEAIFLFLTEDQPSRMIRAAHRYLWQLLQADEGTWSGHCSIAIQPSAHTYKDFVVFLFDNMVEELKIQGPGPQWMQAQGRQLHFNLQYGDEFWVKTFEDHLEVSPDPVAKPADSLNEKQDSLIKSKPWWKFWA
jgi:hypothetical protein